MRERICNAQTKRIQLVSKMSLRCPRSGRRLYVILEILIDRLTRRAPSSTRTCLTLSPRPSLSLSLSVFLSTTTAVLSFRGSHRGASRREGGAEKQSRGQTERTASARNKANCVGPGCEKADVAAEARYFNCGLLRGREQMPLMAPERWAYKRRR
jgi:hypothetical protein